MRLDERIEGYKEDIIKSTQEIVGFKSLKAEPEEGMPFGKALNDTLLYFLGLAETWGSKPKTWTAMPGMSSTAKAMR